MEDRPQVECTPSPLKLSEVAWLGKVGVVGVGGLVTLGEGALTVVDLFANQSSIVPDGAKTASMAITTAVGAKILNYAQNKFSEMEAEMNLDNRGEV